MLLPRCYLGLIENPRWTAARPRRRSTQLICRPCYPIRSN